MGLGSWIIPAIEQPHVSLAAETLFRLGPIPVTNSMLTMFLVMIGLVLFFLFATRRLRATADGRSLLAAPRGAQNFAEFVVEALLNLVESTAGRRAGRRIFPLIATLFLFILTANYSGLLPGVGTIGFQGEAHGEPAHAAQVAQVASVGGAAAASPPASAQEEHAEACAFSVLGFELARAGWLCAPTAPLFRAPNADLNMTIAMALIAVVTVQIAGIASHGAGGYLKEFINPIHLIGELSRVISLAARLFGNIFGGEVLLAVIIALTTPLLFGLVGAIPFIFYGLELFFGFIQALLFSLLTLIYIAVAVAGHGAHEEHEEHVMHEVEHGAAGAAEKAAAELAA